MTTRQLIRTIRNSQRVWTGADWTHEYRRNGESVWEDDEPVYCAGGCPDCTYCSDAKDDAEGAAQIADEAIVAIKAGNLMQAVRLMEEAVRVESEYGDSPAYGDALDAVSAAAVSRAAAPTQEQIQALRDESAIAGDLAMVRLCDRALRGSVRAVRECRRTIAEARAAEV
jgi:hypothetical protein